MIFIINYQNLFDTYFICYYMFKTLTIIKRITFNKEVKNINIIFLLNFNSSVTLILSSFIIIF